MNITLRDWFAGQAIAGMLSNSAFEDRKAPELAYRIADAMILAGKENREKSTKSGGKQPAPPFDELVGAGTIPPNFNSPNFREAWERWLKFRKEIGKAVTATSAAIQIRTLVKMGKALAIESIDQSIRNGWQGLFDVRKQAGQHGQPDYRKRDAADERALEEAWN